jgi:hypothetical protein
MFITERNIIIIPHESNTNASVNYTILLSIIQEHQEHQARQVLREAQEAPHIPEDIQ